LTPTPKRAWYAPLNDIKPTILYPQLSVNVVQGALCNLTPNPGCTATDRAIPAGPHAAVDTEIADFVNNSNASLSSSHARTSGPGT